MAAQVCYESCGKANFEETVCGGFADAHRTDMGGRIGNADRPKRAVRMRFAHRTAPKTSAYALCA